MHIPYGRADNRDGFLADTMRSTERSRDLIITMLEISRVIGTTSLNTPTRERARVSCLTPRRQRMHPSRFCPRTSRKRTSREGESVPCRHWLIYRLWAHLTEAIKKDDMHGATAAKSAVEDKQREKARQREASGQGHPEARFFRNVAGDRWMPKLDLDG
jgi:hypothetical protein